MLKIDFCSSEQVDSVMKFIDNYWKKDHILSLLKELIDYQHLDKKNKRYNFVIAYSNNKIEGLLGFIPSSKYEENNHSFLWLSLWKTIPSASPQLGLKLLSFLEKEVPHKIIGTLGISEEAFKIFKILRYKTGTLNHYYIPNPTIKNYSVCKDPIIKYIDAMDNTNNILELNELDVFVDSYSFIPKRTVKYAKNKYEKHPFYKYTFLYFDKLNLILVTRAIEVNNKKILRIVDAIGQQSNIYKTASLLTSYIIKHNFEYVDLLNYGLDEQLMQKSGFTKLFPDSKTIIPMYFEPFIKNNSVIRYAYKYKGNCLENNVFLYKADADQDRPNVIKNYNGEK